MIVDASLVLRAFFPDEAQEAAQAVIAEHIAGRTRLKAPDLLGYELANAVWQAERCGRIGPDLAAEILAAMAGLQIELVTVAGEEILPLARQFGVSAYDAAYLALAQGTGEPMATGDARLYRAVGEAITFLALVE